MRIDLIFVLNVIVLQCRQKRNDIVGSCVTKKRDKTCPMKFCPKCLLNRFDLMFLRFVSLCY